MAKKPCSVQFCSRQDGPQHPGFCGRCWRELTDEERCGVMFARHAPFWRRYWSDAEEGDLQITSTAVALPDGVRPAFAHGYISVEGYDFDGTRLWAVHAGAYFAAIEERSTLAATAQALYDRRMAQFYSTTPTSPGDQP